MFKAASCQDVKIKII